MAGMGPVSMVTGSTPARAKAWNRARGVRPRALAFSSLMMRTAAAPSVICDELPAVTLPSGLKAGFRLARTSAVVSGRIPSSVAMTSLVAAPSSSLTASGRISRSKRPSAVARAASCWLRAPKASRSWRDRSHWSAIISAEMPCDTRPPRSA